MSGIVNTFFILYHRCVVNYCMSQCVQIFASCVQFNLSGVGDLNHLCQLAVVVQLDHDIGATYKLTVDV